MTSALSDHRPLTASHHPDSEPRGDAENGSPCPFCHLPIWYERSGTGQPMRWAHQDGTPRCDADITALRQAMAHLTGTSSDPDSTAQAMVAVFDIYVAMSRHDLSYLANYSAQTVVELARRVLRDAEITAPHA